MKGAAALRRWLWLGPLLLAVGAPRAAGENWPGWRGPNRDGVTVDRGAPTTWSPTEHVLWKTPLPGSGISNPIVWNDLVVCTSSDGARQQDLHVIGLQAATGAKRWHARLWGTAPTLYHETKSSMASPSPICDGQRIYAFFGSGDVFCLDLAGRLQWQRSLAAEYGEFENRFAASSSPLLFDDLLILQCDHFGASYLLAIDKRTGANRWKTDRPEAWLSWSSPIVAPTAAGAELIVAGSEKLDGFDPQNGRRLWTFSGLARECIPTPIFSGGRLYVVSGPGSASFALRTGGRGDVTGSHAIWSYARGNPFVPSALVVADRYYLIDDHGIGTCLNAATGKPLWKKRLGGDFTASPVAADGKIYFTNESGSTVVLRAGIDRYEVLARNEIGEPVFASPAIAGGKILLRSRTQLWCLGEPPRAAATSP